MVLSTIIHNSSNKTSSAVPVRFGAVYLWFGVICKSSLVLFCLLWCYLQVIFGAVSLWSGVIYLQVIFGAVYLWSGVVICKSFLVLFLFVLVLSANYRL